MLVPATSARPYSELMAARKLSEVRLPAASDEASEEAIAELICAIDCVRVCVCPWVHFPAPPLCDFVCDSEGAREIFRERERPHTISDPGQGKAHIGDCRGHCA